MGHTLLNLLFYRRMKRPKLFLRILFVFTCLTGLHNVANASLIGNEVYLTWGPPQDRIIGDGVEFHAIFDSVGFDFAADTLTLSFGGPSMGWSGFDHLVFRGFSERITGLSIVSNTGFQGSMLNDFSFSDHTIDINMTYGSASNYPLLVYKINTDGLDGSSVLEPATGFLIGLGFLFMIMARRRKTTSGRSARLA